MYEAGKYSKAIRLLNKYPQYRGKPQAEKLFYMFSQSYYKTKHTLSGYQFENFVSSYPKVRSTRSSLFRPKVILSS
jgi:outer membrane protein assembly factor BamD